MCVFCSIVKGDIPSYKIYEDENFLAFLDISNDVEGHTLVIPKQHFIDLDECPDDYYIKLMLLVKKISKHFLNLGYSGINIVSNCKKDAGQEIEHFHVHIFPRKKADGAKLVMHEAIVKSDLNEISKKLRMS